MGFLQRTFARIVSKALASPILDRGGWLPVIRESYPGAWQQNVTVDFNLVLSYHAVFACITLIASDIAKLRVKLVENDGSGIWTEITNPAYSPVLRKQNPFQNRIQFWENWVTSKLTRGNTYVLKQRDGRGVVTRLYILDPNRVRPLVSDQDGSVFYELNTDNISAIKSLIIVPAREIIHDRMNCLFHPLVGTSPIFAGGLAATQGINIQNDSATFFGNKSRPGGLLVAPGRIAAETAKTLKTYWDENFSGTNRGKIAVVGDGLKYQGLSVNAEDSQLIEQLKWTAEVVCSTFHVPPYKIGVGTMPSYNNIQALNVEYYSQCLQRLIEDAELCLDEGLEMVPNIGTEFDLDGLLRMDTVTQVTAIRDSIGAGFMSPNEGRKKMDLMPVKGGESPYLQQQNYSLEALAKRDSQEDPFATAQPTAEPATPPDDDEPEEDDRVLNGFEIEALLTKGAQDHAIG
jgi:HK97 family phage portal protein